MGLFDRFSKKEQDKKLNETLDQVLEKALLCMESDDEAVFDKGYNAIIRAAEMGHIPSLMVMGELLEEDHPEEAITWYEQAAAAGATGAMDALIWLYGEIESAENKKKLFRLLEYYAPRRNHEDLYVLLGTIYMRGEGCEYSPEKAFKVLSEAVKTGSASGQYLLGLLYEKGQGCTIDILKAQELFKNAYAGGCEQAKEKAEYWERFNDSVNKSQIEFAKKHINSSDPELRSMAKKILDQQ